MLEDSNLGIITVDLTSNCSHYGIIDILENKCGLLKLECSNVENAATLQNNKQNFKVIEEINLGACDPRLLNIPGFISFTDQTKFAIASDFEKFKRDSNFFEQLDETSKTEVMLKVFYKSWQKERESMQDLKYSGNVRCDRLTVLKEINISIRQQNPLSIIETTENQIAAHDTNAKIEKNSSSISTKSSRSTNSSSSTKSSKFTTLTTRHLPILRDDYYKLLFPLLPPNSEASAKLKESMREKFPAEEAYEQRKRLMKIFVGFCKTLYGNEIKRKKIVAAQKSPEELQKVIDQEAALSNMIQNIKCEIRKIQANQCGKKTATRKWNGESFKECLATVDLFQILKVKWTETIVCCNALRIHDSEQHTSPFFQNIWNSLNNILAPEFVIISMQEVDRVDSLVHLYQGKDTSETEGDSLGYPGQNIQPVGKPILSFLVEFKYPTKFPSILAKNSRVNKTGLTVQEFNEIINSVNIVDFMEHPIYDTDHCVVRQIRDYLIQHGLRYGIICSFDRFIFCHLDDSDILCSINLTDIYFGSSNPFTQSTDSFDGISASSSSSISSSFDDSKSWSIYQVILRFIFYIKKNGDYKLDTQRLASFRAAQENHRKSNPPRDSGRSRPNSGSNKKSNDYFNGGNLSTSSSLNKKTSTNNQVSKTEQNPWNNNFKLISWCDIKDAEVIGRGRTGPCYRKNLNGFDCVCKCLFRYERNKGLTIEDWVDPQKIERELNREAEVYMKLKRIQGQYIPNLLAYESLMFNSVVTLVTEYAGKSTNNYLKLNKLQYESAKKGLQTIHNHGILHGDIKLSNIVISKEHRNKMIFIDFAFAKFKDEFNDDEDWKNAITKEMAALDSVFGWHLRMLESTESLKESKNSLLGKKGAKKRISNISKNAEKKVNKKRNRNTTGQVF